MNKARSAALRKLCLDAASKPEGARAKDLGIPRTTACLNLHKLMEAGLVFKAGHHFEMRYFDTPEKASAFSVSLRAQRAPAKLSFVPMAKARPTRRGPWPADAPMHFPVDAKGKPLWKHTVAPKPPQSFHTNTFAK